MTVYNIFNNPISIMEVPENVMDQITLNELNDKNNWEKISAYNFNLEQLYELKNRLNWNTVLLLNSNITIEFLEKLLDEGFFEDYLENNGYFIKRSLKISLSKLITNVDIIEKHRNCFIINTLLKNNKFKLSEIARIIKKPEVGMGATIYFGSDSYSCTIIKVNRTGTKIEIQEDNSKLKAGHTLDDQEYDYFPNPKGRIYKVNLRKDAIWRVAYSSQSVSVGSRRRYYNQSF